MNSSAILWPVLAQVFLTVMIYILMGARKANAVKAGLVDRKQAALDNRVWPADVIKVNNNVANQFEVPVLFYALCLVLFSVNAAGTLGVVLAWAFVISRYAHAYVHVGSNYVPLRMKLFMFGTLMVLAMLVLAAWRLAAIG